LGFVGDLLEEKGMGSFLFKTFRPSIKTYWGKKGKISEK
jgi:hypothetical protein